MSLVRRMESRQALVRHHTWPWVFVAPLESSCLPRPTAPPPIIESIEGLAARRKAQGDAGSHRQVPIVVRLFPRFTPSTWQPGQGGRRHLRCRCAGRSQRQCDCYGDNAQMYMQLTNQAYQHPYARANSTLAVGFISQLTSCNDPVVDDESSGRGRTARRLLDMRPHPAASQETHVGVPAPASARPLPQRRLPLSGSGEESTDFRGGGARESRARVSVATYQSPNPGLLARSEGQN